MQKKKTQAVARLKQLVNENWSKSDHAISMAFEPVTKGAV